MMKALLLAAVCFVSSSATAAIFDSIESVDALKAAHPTTNAGRTPAGEPTTEKKTTPPNEKSSETSAERDASE